MIDSYLLLTPILALPLVGLLIFIGCDLIFTLDPPEPDVPFLSANTSYFLLSEEKTPGDQIYNRTIPLTTTDVALLEGAVRGTAPPFEQFAGDTAYGPLNFEY